MRFPSGRPSSSMRVVTSRSLRVIARTARQSASASLILLLAACGTVHPEPFVAFSTSLQNLKTNAESVLASNVSSMEERFVADTSELTDREELADAAKPLKFTVAVKEGDGNDPFAWNVQRAGSGAAAKPLPLFLAAEQMGVSLNALNATFAKYGAALVELSSTNLIKQDEFTKLSTDLNSNLYSALTAAGSSADPKSLALFSTIAGDAARRFIESRRQSDLLEALKEHQDKVDGLAALGQSVARGLAYARSTDYQDDAQALLVGLLTAGDADARETKLNALIALDRAHIDEMNALRAINDAYAALPGAHRELRAAVEHPGLNLASIETLYGEAKRLESIYSNLRLTNQSRSDQIAADAAQARADALKTEATAARKKATEERAAANAETDASEKARKDEHAKKLEDHATKLEAAAKAAQKAADAAESKASESKAAATAASSSGGSKVGK